MKQKGKNRILSLAVVLTLLLCILPVNALAADHVHDESCGYAAPADCNHTVCSTEVCGYVAEVTGNPCDHETGTHEGCGYVAEVPGTSCAHALGNHDAACGYHAGSACSMEGWSCDHAACGYSPAVICEVQDCTHESCGQTGGTPCPNANWTCSHEDCGYVEAAACGHGENHNADCGYSAGTPGTPCGHTTHDSTCGYVEAVTGTACGHNHDAACGYSEGAACNYAVVPANEHTHVWSTEWSGNNSYHWHECIAEGCDLTHSWGEGKGDYAKHEFDITSDTHDIVDPAGCGIHVGTCKRCGRSDSQIFIAATLQFDDTHHWYECPCGVIGWMEGPEKAEHRFDDDADTTCNDCGYVRTASGGTTVNGVITLTTADLVDGASGEGWSFAENILTINSGYTLKFDGTCGANVENNGTIESGTFSGRVANHGTIAGGTIGDGFSNDGTITGGIINCKSFHNKGTISGGTINAYVTNENIITGGIFNNTVSNNKSITGGVFKGIVGSPYSSTITGTADLSEADLNDRGGQYGKGVKLPKAEIWGNLIYTGCENSTEITLEYYADGAKTAEWTVSGERYSYQVEGWKRTDPDAELSGIAEISHEVKAASMDGYEITVSKVNNTKFRVTVQHTHTYGTEWKSDGTNHWHECSCGAKAEEAAHSGGTATCTEKAKCTVCGTEYGSLAEHTYGTEWKSDGTNHWHECSCGAKSGEAAHNGGTATCTEKAKCTACGTEYGSFSQHTYGTQWKSDGTNHWHECSCGAKSGEAAHSGGTATCTEKAKCSVCKAEYGELGRHTYTSTVTAPTCTEKGYTTHTCSCGDSYKDTYVKATGHSFTKYVSDKNATCKKNGTETAKCDHGCGETKTRTDYGSRLRHKFVNGVCTRCRVDQWTWNPDTGDQIMVAVTVLTLSGAALVLLLVLGKKQRRDPV